MLRLASTDELDAVYLLGRDAWGGDLPEFDYLSSCRASPKYARGRFHVLVRDGAVAAACIVYPAESFGGSAPGVAVGIGSVATAQDQRRRGHATTLLRLLLELLEGEGVGVFFLHSDVAPAIYERLGFQRFPGSIGGAIPMVRVAGGGVIAPSFFEQVTMPRYF